MKLMLKYKYILHCFLTNFFLTFFTASMFKNKNVSLTFFQSDSNCVVWTKCTILLCIKDRFVQELVQTSQKKFSAIKPNGLCRLDTKNILGLKKYICNVIVLGIS